MNILSLFLAALVVASPPKSSVELPMVSHAGQIVERVERVTRCEEFRFLDPFFVCPTRTQFVEMMKFCAANRTAEYQTDLFDCEDHAREFRVFASRWALKTYSGLPCGLAVGQAIVRIGGQVDGLGAYGPGTMLHAMIIVVLADGQVLLVEPRNSRYIFPLSAVYEGVIEFHSIEF